MASITISKGDNGGGLSRAAYDKALTDIDTNFTTHDTAIAARAITTKKITIDNSLWDLTLANTTEHVLEFADVVPAMARIVDCFTYTTEAYVFSGGATTLVAEVGTTSSGHEILGSATIYAKDAFNGMAHDHVLTIAPVTTATHLFIAATPGANWSTITAGSTDLYITYIDVTGIVATDIDPE